MAESMDYEGISSIVGDHIRQKSIPGTRTLTHYTDVPFSVMRHICDLEKETFTIDYADHEKSSHLTLQTGSLTDVSLQRSSLFHSHNFYEMMIVVSGEMRVLFHGLEYCYHPGDASLVNREINHCEFSDRSYQVIYISMLPAYIRSVITGGSFVNPSGIGDVTAGFFRSDLKNEACRTRSYVRYLCREETDGLDRLCAETDWLFHEMNERQAGFECIALGRMIRIFSLLSDTDRYLPERIDLGVARDEDVLRDACRYIERRKASMTTEELASAMNYSAGYISRLFRKYMNTTVLTFTRSVCLKEAARLLSTTDLSISAVMRRVGYENRTYFNRIFRECYGMSPQEFRKEVR